MVLEQLVVDQRPAHLAKVTSVQPQSSPHRYGERGTAAKDLNAKLTVHPPHRTVDQVIGLDE
jgi:hypothetical protein